MFYWNFLLVGWYLNFSFLFKHVNLYTEEDTPEHCSFQIYFYSRAYVHVKFTYDFNVSSVKTAIVNFFPCTFFSLYQFLVEIHKNNISWRGRTAFFIRFLIIVFSLLFPSPYSCFRNVLFGKDKIHQENFRPHRTHKITQKPFISVHNRCTALRLVSFWFPEPVASFGHDSRMCIRTHRQLKKLSKKI